MNTIESAGHSWTSKILANSPDRETRRQVVGDSAYPGYPDVSLFHLLDILTIFRSLLLSFDTYIYRFIPYCTSAVHYDYMTDWGAYIILFLSLTYFLRYVHIAVDTLTGSVYNKAVHYDYVTDWAVDTLYQVNSEGWWRWRCEWNGDLAVRNG